MTIYFGEPEAWVGDPAPATSVLEREQAACVAALGQGVVDLAYSDACRALIGTPDYDVPSQDECDVRLYAVIGPRSNTLIGGGLQFNTTIRGEPVAIRVPAHLQIGSNGSTETIVPFAGEGNWRIGRIIAGLEALRLYRDVFGMAVTADLAASSDKPPRRIIEAIQYRNANLDNMFR